MFQLFVFLCVSLIVRTVYSTVDLEQPKTPPAKFAGHPGCYLKRFDEMIPEEIPYFPKDKASCLAYYCQNDGYIISIECSPETASSNCQVTQDLTLDYPDCCKQYHCPARG